MSAGLRTLLAGTFLATVTAGVGIASCAPQVTDLELVLFDDDAGGRPFTCIDPASPGHDLLDRVAPGAAFWMALDFIAVSGVSSCRSTTILDYCATSGCPILPNRQCVPLTGPAGATPEERLKNLSAQLHALGQTFQVPASEAIIVRAVFTLEKCDPEALDAGFDLLLVSGCATSCPVGGYSASGQLQLDLDVAPNDKMCAGAACVCAEFGTSAQAKCGSL